MCASQCEEFWDLADFFPFEDAIHHWCNGSQKCLQARAAALLTALDRGEVKYRRADGNDFPDSVYELKRRQLLLVERESFLDWAKKVSNEIERSSLQRNVAISPKTEANYLRILGACAELILETEYGDGKKYSPFTTQTDLIEKLTILGKGVPGLSERNLQAKFAEARREFEAAKEDR
ncbi:MAG: hypothetical protein R3F50_17105 [Gammaproteobacteria bacterium]